MSTLEVVYGSRDMSNASRGAFCAPVAGMSAAREFISKSLAKRLRRAVEAAPR